MKNKAMTESLIEFGRWVRRWRKEFGYKQEELGEMVGVKKQYISNIERAEPSSYTGKPSRPDIRIVDKFALTFQRPVKEARNLAGYGLPDASVNTIEEALDAALFFDQKGLNESDRKALRPLLEVADREVDRLRKMKDLEPVRIVRPTSRKDVEKLIGGKAIEELNDLPARPGGRRKRRAD